MQRPFQVLGIQQIAIGGPDKAKLQRLWEAQEKATREHGKFHQSKRISEGDARELVAKAAKAMTKGKQ